MLTAVDRGENRGTLLTGLLDFCKRRHSVNMVCYGVATKEQQFEFEIINVISLSAKLQQTCSVFNNVFVSLARWCSIWLAVAFRVA